MFHLTQSIDDNNIILYSEGDRYDPLFLLEQQMPTKRKTKEIKKTDREQAHKQETPVEVLGLQIDLTPVQMQQINVLAQVAHNEEPAVYCRKIILQHVADRLYLVRR